MLKRLITLAGLLTAAALTQAQPIVFDLTTLSLTLPEVVVGTGTYKLVMRYDADGRMTITSATPATPPAQTTPNMCQFSISDSRGSLAFSVSKVTRIDPNNATTYDANFNVVPTEPLMFYKLTAQVTSGSPFFCTSAITLSQAGRQVPGGISFWNSDSKGPDASYPTCETLQPGTKTIVYAKTDYLVYDAPFFNVNQPFNLTYLYGLNETKTTICTP